MTDGRSPRSTRSSRRRKARSSRGETVVTPRKPASPVEAVALVPAAGLGTRFTTRPKALVSFRAAAAPARPGEAPRLRPGERGGRRRNPGYEGAFRSLARAPLPGPWWKEGDAAGLRRERPRGFGGEGRHPRPRPRRGSSARRPGRGRGGRRRRAERGAAIAGFAMVNTVKRIRGGKVVETVPVTTSSRSRPRRFSGRSSFGGPTPERGRRRHGRLRAGRAAGGTVAVVLTSRWNLKITYPETSRGRGHLASPKG